MKLRDKNPVLFFAITFLVLFAVFYYFNILFFGITTRTGSHYVPFLDAHFNYIRWLRWALLHGSKTILEWLGHTCLVDDHELLVVGKGTLQVVYTCLGLGILSFFAAFVLAYPKALKPKIIFLLVGMTAIELLNLLRFILVILFWNRHTQKLADHHTIFNIAIYIIIAISLYFWVTSKKNIQHAHENH